METWTRPDTKQALPPGVWQTEPDKAVWIDPDTGLDCMINRGYRGVLCGYVAVPPGHVFHGREGYDCLIAKAALPHERDGHLPTPPWDTPIDPAFPSSVLDRSFDDGSNPDQEP